MSNLRQLRAQLNPEQEQTRTHKPFKAYEPGYIHIDVKYLPQMADEDKRSYLFVAIDRATRWVYVQVRKTKTAADAAAFVKALYQTCPVRIKTILTDNGAEFTSRLRTRDEEKQANHVFVKACAAIQAQHRLTRVRRPQTNGMVERFNGRIADVLQTHRFSSSEDLISTLKRYVHLYNQEIPQSVLQTKTPMEVMKECHKKKPELFKKKPRNLAGCDICSDPIMRWQWVQEAS